MDTASEIRLLKCAAVFVPEIGPLVPAIIKALDTASKVETALGPAMARIEQGQPAILELGEAAPAINDLLPDITAAAATLAKVRAVAAKCEAAVAAQLV